MRMADASQPAHLHGQCTEQTQHIGLVGLLGQDSAITCLLFAQSACLMIRQAIIELLLLSHMRVGNVIRFRTSPN